jgi:hypothetical protein
MEQRMPFDLALFTGPALELVRLSQGAAIGFGSPATLRENRRIADGLIRAMVRLRQVVEKSGWVPMPPPGASVSIPTPNHGWTEADGQAWRMVVQQTIADLVAACRKMVRRCWELAPDPPANGSDEGTIQKYNAAAQRALEEHRASEAEVGELTQRLWNFGQQARFFPPTIETPTPGPAGAQALNPDRLAPSTAASGRAAEERDEDDHRPRWDRQRRQVWLGDDLLCTYVRHAPAQFALLDALQQAGWSQTIAAPRTRHSIKDAVEALNNRLEATRLRIQRLESDTRIEWRLTPV